jgi:O-antigen ligase/tetratricopeptide (TPR) repeat protein
MLFRISMQRQDAIRWLKAITYLGIYGGLLMPAVFIPVVIFPFVFSKLIAFQILIGLTFPAYLVLAWAEPQYRPRPSMLYLAIAAYFVAIAASVIFSVDVARSWWGNQERMNGLFTLLHFFAWLTMTVGLIKTWPQWRRLLNYEIGLSLFMAIVAILQKPFPKLLMFAAGDRVGGLLDNPIYMAAYQIFNLFFIALLWLKGASRNQKIWYAVVAAFDIIAFMLAQSRGALLGLAAGIVVFAVAYAIMTPNKKAKAGVLLAMTLCFVGYGALVALRDTEFIRNSPLERFTNFSLSSRTRLIAWEIAWKGFLERPMTGWGIDTFHILFNKHYNPESLRFGYYETWFDRSHNTIMDVLSMTGLFGFVTFAAIFIALYWSVFRARRRGWIDIPVTSVLVALPVAYFIQNLFVFDHPAAFSMSFLMYALVIGATTAQFSDKRDDGSSPAAASTRAVSWAFFGILQVLAIVLVWRASVLPFKASMLSIKSNNAFGSGAYQLAYDQARQAAAIHTPYLDEQTFLQSRNFITVAGSGKLQELPFWRDWHDLIVRVTDRHLSAHSENAHPRFIYARFAEAMGPLVPDDFRIAEEQYQKALELSPKRQQLFYSYARFLIDHGKSDKALELLKQVVDLDVELGESHWLLGLHYYFDRQMLQEGADELIKAVTVKYPYSFREAREVMALAMAYDTKGQKEELVKLMDLLPTLPRASSAVYVQIARVMEHQGLIEERDRILKALINIDAMLALRLAPLFNGSAATIDEAMKQTEGIEASAPTTTTPTTSPVATSSGSTKGPRK